MFFGSTVWMRSFLPFSLNILLNTIYHCFWYWFFISELPSIFSLCFYKLYETSNSPAAFPTPPIIIIQLQAWNRAFKLVQVEYRVSAYLSRWRKNWNNQILNFATSTFLEFGVNFDSPLGKPYKMHIWLVNANFKFSEWI